MKTEKWVLRQNQELESWSIWVSTFDINQFIGNYWIELVTLNYLEVDPESRNQF